MKPIRRLMAGLIAGASLLLGPSAAKAATTLASLTNVPGDLTVTLSRAIPGAWYAELPLSIGATSGTATCGWQYTDYLNFVPLVPLSPIGTFAIPFHGQSTVTVKCQALDGGSITDEKSFVVTVKPQSPPPIFGVPPSRVVISSTPVPFVYDNPTTIEGGYVVCGGAPSGYLVAVGETAGVLCDANVPLHEARFVGFGLTVKAPEVSIDPKPTPIVDLPPAVGRSIDGQSNGWRISMKALTKPTAGQSTKFAVDFVSDGTGPGGTIFLEQGWYWFSQFQLLACNSEGGAVCSNSTTARDTTAEGVEHGIIVQAVKVPEQSAGAKVQLIFSATPNADARCTFYTSAYREVSVNPVLVAPGAVRDFGCA